VAHTGKKYKKRVSW